MDSQKVTIERYIGQKIVEISDFIFLKLYNINVFNIGSLLKSPYRVPLGPNSEIHVIIQKTSIKLNPYNLKWKKNSNLIFYIIQTPVYDEE